jgi:hypothetical protein
MKAAIALALSTLPCTTDALIASPALIPGGVLDDRFAGQDIYRDAPFAAKAPAGKACAAAKAYVDDINAGKFGETADLFAKDALLMHPPGHIHRGVDAIRAFFIDTIGPLHPEIVPVGYIEQRQECMVELAARVDIGHERRFMLASVDHMTVDDRGKIARLISFARPRGSPVLQ